MSHVTALLIFSSAVFAADVTTGDYSAYVGDANECRVAAIATDAAGNTYVAGTRILEFSVSGPVSDVFVSKLDSSGSALFTVTIGSTGRNQANAIALDPAGNIYIAGSTSSRNFPLHNALQSQPGSAYLIGITGFLVKLSPDGSSLLYSTYFGGTQGASSVNAVAVDAKGDVYLTGFTFSTDFPYTEGLPTGRLHYGGLEDTSAAFISKITAAGDRIVYSGGIVGTMLACGGGSSCFLSTRKTAGVGIALDAAGDAYVIGNTNTTNIPTTQGALLLEGIGAFVAKVNSTGSALAYLTYLGAASRAFGGANGQISGSIAHAIAVDAAGNAYVAGSTWDSRFPTTPDAFQPIFAGPDSSPDSSDVPPPTDAFVAKLRPDGAAMVWATYLGGAAADSAQSIALDSSGNIWVSGTTASPEFPNSNGWSQGADFLVGLNSSGSALIYSARFPADSVSRSVATDSHGLVHMAGAGGLVSAISPNQPSSMRVFAISNAAGGFPGARIAPGELISLFGPHLGPPAPVTFMLDSSRLAPKVLAGVEVLIDDSAVPLLYVSKSRIDAIAPSHLANGAFGRVRVSFNGAETGEFRVVVSSAAPEIFSNAEGGAAALNEDGSVNSFISPAKAGSIVSIWVTGTGILQPVDGKIAISAQDYRCCAVQVGNQMAEVLYAGTAPGIVSEVTQINFRLPPNEYGEIRVIAGSRASSPVSLRIGN